MDIMGITINDPLTMLVGGSLFFILIGLMKDKKKIVSVGIIIGFLGIVLFLYSSGVMPTLTSRNVDISVSSSPTGASIYLDGINKGKTPMDLNNIKQGPHDITLELAEYEDWSQNVNVNASTGPISPTLTPIPTEGEIQVSSPTGASVFLDGTDKGKTPITLNNIEQGQHNVTLKLAGYEDWYQPINVEADKTILISPTLTPIQTEGNISISSSPDEARIDIDGTYEGETPTILNNIKQGFHEITLELNGYEDWTQTINVDIGKTTQVSAELTPTEIPETLTETGTSGTSTETSGTSTETSGTSTEIEITSPVDGAQVDITEYVKGTQKNIPEDKALWIVVFPHKSNNYHPVEEVPIHGDTPDFSVNVILGRQESVGEKFDIIAMLADETAQEKFTNYLSTAADNNWQGIDLPDGTEEYARVTVTRK